MTDNDYRENVLVRLKGVEDSIGALSSRIVAVEMKSAIDEVHRLNVEKRLTAIESGITRLTWIILTPLVLAVLGFAIRQGVTI